jgi:hypothetical protein
MRISIKQEGYVVSCIPYVKPRAMKEELNGLFLAKHGDWLEDREVTLSKLRSLKSQIVEIVKMLDLELSTAGLPPPHTRNPKPETRNPPSLRPTNTVPSLS